MTLLASLDENQDGPALDAVAEAIEQRPDATVNALVNRTAKAWPPCRFHPELMATLLKAVAKVGAR